MIFSLFLNTNQNFQFSMRSSGLVIIAISYHAGDGGSNLGDLGFFCLFFYFFLFFYGILQLFVSFFIVFFIVLLFFIFRPSSQVTKGVISLCIVSNAQKYAFPDHSIFEFHYMTKNSFNCQQPSHFWYKSTEHWCLDSQSKYLVLYFCSLARFVLVDVLLSISQRWAFLKFYGSIEPFQFHTDSLALSQKQRQRAKNRQFVFAVHYKKLRTK